MKQLRSVRVKPLARLLSVSILTVLSLTLTLNATSPSVNDWALSSGDEAKSLQISGYTFEGEYLVITYTVPYPGMTKVKLFNGPEHMLWRSQYVNEEGEHKLYLRSKYLKSGENYVFEFDYKSKVQNFAVMRP